jgi:hypothetical protein
MIIQRVVCLFGLIVLFLSACDVAPKTIPQPSYTPAAATAISSATPTDRPATATLEPTQTPTCAPETPTITATQLSPAILEDAVVLYRAGTDAEPQLGAVLPGELNRVRLAGGCALTFGLDSKGRVPVTLGESMGEGCYSSYYYNERLFLVTLPDLDLIEITYLTSYYGVTTQAYAIDEVPLEVLYVTDVTAWSKPAWSHDGRYLAFVAAIEGPSSDLYIYDSLNDTIERKSSGLNQAADPIWSPDGTGIIHYEYEYYPIDIEPYAVAPRALWWAPLDGGSLLRFADSSMGISWPMFGGWLSDSRFMFWYSGPGAVNGGNLLIGDVVTGEKVNVLERVTSAITLYNEEGGLVLALIENEDGDDELYLFDDHKGQLILLQTSSKNSVKRIATQESLAQFLVAIRKKGLLRVMPDGTMEILDRLIDPDSMFMSSDCMHATVEDGNRHWIYSFDESGQVSTKVQIEEGNMLAWRPDDQAVLLGCLSGSILIAQSPDWESRWISGVCPAWEGWRNRMLYLPTGVLWLNTDE